MCAARRRILLVEDDERVGSTLLRVLESSGYDARWERNGTDGIASAGEHHPDLVLLDLGLPDVDGLDVCRSIRLADDSVVIVMLTARDEELDVVVGLDAGAVDYITKPFKLAEPLARIRAQLRRTTPLTASTETAIGDLMIDAEARRAWLNGTVIEPRAKEFDLLARVLADAGTVIPRETLMSDVWDEHWLGSTKTLDFHIAALRNRIDTEGQASRISTMRGVGLRYKTS